MNRRQFLRTVGVMGATMSLSAETTSQTGTLNAALIGCGIRGTGAVFNLLNADGNIKIKAMADIYEGQIVSSFKRIRKTFPDRIAVKRQDLYLGLDAYQKIAERQDIDIVILATPTYFRPFQLRQMIRAGKHVFAETPWAVDAPGIRICRDAVNTARRQGLTLTSGLHHRYAPAVQETMDRIHAGSLGDIHSLKGMQHFRAPVINPRGESNSDIAYMLQNWSEYSWLGGDHLIDQSLYAIDRFSWALKDKTPLSATAVGGRQSLENNSVGNTFDHFAVQYDFGGIDLNLMTRRQNGLVPSSKETAKGSLGSVSLKTGRFMNTGGQIIWAPKADARSIYDMSMLNFVGSIRRGNADNDGGRALQANLAALLGREAAYKGKTITAEQYLKSNEVYGPKGNFDLNSSYEAAQTPRPGITS